MSSAVNGSARCPPRTLSGSATTLAGVIASSSVSRSVGGIQTTGVSGRRTLAIRRPCGDAGSSTMASTSEG